MTFQLVSGDCLDALAEMPEASVDAVVTDPPYGLSAEPDAAEVLRHWLDGDDYQHRGGGFMGKTWDSFVPGPKVWAECHRVLKPGGHLVAFFGTRTYDLGAMAIRLAGFEVRDCLAWMYGSGFPKSLDVSKAIDKAAGAEREVVGEQTKARSEAGLSALPTMGAEVKYETWNLTAPATPAAQKWQGWGTALKPAFEPIILARKPLTGTVAANVQEYGTGALNIDGGRVQGPKGDGNWKGVSSRQRGEDFQGYDGGWDDGQPGEQNNSGRWPANVILDPEAGAALNEMSGESVSRFFMSIGFSTLDLCGERSTRAENTSAGRRTESSDDASPTAGPGSRKTDRSRPDTTSTTGTTTRSTTGSKTSNSSNAADTRNITEQSEPPKSSATENADAATAKNGNPSTSSTSGAPDRGSLSAENVAASPSASGESRTANATTPICGNTASAAQPSDRFFYCAKASRGERNAGLDGFEERRTGALNMRSEADGHAVRTGQVPQARANVHPTVKPLDLMRYLVRLVTPPGGTVLDPFTGSGTTGIAAGLEGFDFIGIEREAEYRKIAEARLKWWADKEGETGEILRRAGLAEKERERAQTVGQVSLFDEAA